MINSNNIDYNVLPRVFLSFFNLILIFKKYSCVNLTIMFDIQFGSYIRYFCSI